jgi:alpha-N-arabinofuranosidase
MEPNDVGTDEFLEFCELVGAEPLLCTSYNVGTPEDAAAQVEYCNGGPDTEWGAVRARNGRVRPFSVHYWQVGNEQGGEEYEAKFVAYVRAMRAVDPSIEILASSAGDGILRAGADVIDYMSPHYYTPSLRDVVADIEVERERIARLGKGRRIRLGITEWNQSAGDWGAARALMATQENALFCARELAIYQRNSDMIAIANRSNLTNSWCCGLIQTTRDALYVTPAYYAMQLMSKWSGNRALRVGDGDGHELLGAEFGSVLDASATLSEDGARLTVSVVNDGPEAVATTLHLRAHLSGQRSATWHVLAADGPNAVNEAARPDRVRPKTEAGRVGPEAKRVFPPWSLTLLVVDVR